MMRSRTHTLFVMSLAAAVVVAFGCAEGELAAPAPPELEAPQVEERAYAPLAVQTGVGSEWFAGVPGTNLEIVDYPVQNAGASATGSILNDIVQHLPASYGSTYYDEDPITWAHETSHGIHAHLRNNFNPTSVRSNAFYILADKAVFVAEPNIRKSDINSYVPTSLRGSRYDLYLQGSTSWDDTPLYIWDEWNSYVNGAAAGVNLVETGNWNRGWRDGVAGELEFVVYALATAMAVRDLDPTYFAQNTQFREFLAFNIARSMESFRVGAEMPDFAWDTQDNYLAALESSPDASELRAFADELFGELWVDAILFGDGTITEPQPDSSNPPIDPPPIVEEPDPNTNPNPEQPGTTNLGDLVVDLGGGNAGVVDSDNDGVLDDRDLCLGTLPGATVWIYGEWMGCAGGELRSRLPPLTVADSDFDGVGDDRDLCSNTPSGHLVWSAGEWTGCGHGQLRDTGPIGGLDADGDGIADLSDLCSDSPLGATVWQQGEWMGCAEGQFKD